MIAALIALSVLAPAPPKVIASVRLPFTSSASPAVGAVRGRPVVAVTSDNIGDTTRTLDDPRNVNAVTLLGWRGGALRPLPGWPRKTRDATLGLSMADLDGDGRDEVLGACGQDRPPALMEESGLWLTSRLYAWRADGRPFAPWYPWEGAGVRGMAFGHAYAAPAVVDLNGDDRLEILHASQGIWEGGAFQRGSLRLWSPGGRILALTQADSPRLPWYTRPGFASDTTPVVADLNADGRLDVVAATFTGGLYAWDAAGRSLPGWLPSDGATTVTANGALIRGAVSAADIDGLPGDEVLAGGYDGALYCFTKGGRRLWRSVAAQGKPAPLTSGVAVGRLRRGCPPERDAVVGDGAGGVTAFRPTGAVLWRAMTTPGLPVEAEPAIGDVNADGTQDVVVGGTDGVVYAFDGETGRALWRVPTVSAPTLEGMRLEGVFGAPALCDLRGDGHLCVVVATAHRYIADVAAHKWQGFGHVMVFDCGPGTYRADRLDWPQYRHDKMRTGRLSAPRP